MKVLFPVRFRFRFSSFTALRHFPPESHIPARRSRPLLWNVLSRFGAEGSLIAQVGI